NEEALHGESTGTLTFGEEVCYKRAEGLHAHVNGGVENPEHAGGHPERSGVRHEDQHERAEDGAGEEIRTAAAETSPGVIAGVADEGLDDEAREGCGEPKDGNLIGPCAQVLIDGAHVRHLK